MRWWMTFDPPYLMSVDNSSVMGMDYSEILADDPDLWMVHWQEGKGEIEHQTVDKKNENGLRESFYDVTPYVGYFQQFLERMQAKDLTLDQARKVQIDLIKMLYEAKRQAPYHHPIAAGDYWWDATDGVLSGSTAGIQNKLNEVVSALNTVISTVNNHAGVGNALTGSINNNIVTGSHDEIDYLNNSILGIYQTFTDTNTINDSLRRGLPADQFGLIADILPSPKYVVDVNPGSFNSISLSPITGTGGANWIPLGQTAPVAVTSAEQSAILAGIAARRDQLYLIEMQKIGEVLALTTIPGVISYDVLADWPVVPSSPFKLEPPIVPIGGGLTLIGTFGGGSGDFPEAPVDGVTYGRRNMAWNPALALSGDVLDGGTF